MVEQQQPLQEQDAPAVRLDGLTYAYPGCEASVKDVSLDLPRGARCLLIGANGAGKTTLLQLLAGKYMVGRDVVTVLGRSPFYDLQLTCTGQLGYLGTSWRKDVAFAGYGVPLQGDITAGKMLFGVQGADPARRERLIELLDIDLYQRLTTMSDGQRRRVQIAMGLLKPYDVLLMDEITVDMDVLGRQELLDFFRAECEERGATIIYATHIFDGLDPWVTHVAYLEGGELKAGGARALVRELAPVAAAADGSGSINGSGDGEGGGGVKLLHVVEGWLRKEKEARHARAEADAAAAAANGSAGAAAPVAPTRTPHMPSKHLAFFR